MWKLEILEPLFWRGLHSSISFARCTTRIGDSLQKKCVGAELISNLCKVVIPLHATQTCEVNFMGSNRSRMVAGFLCIIPLSRGTWHVHLPLVWAILRTMYEARSCWLCKRMQWVLMSPCWCKTLGLKFIKASCEKMEIALCYNLRTLVDCVHHKLLVVFWLTFGVFLCTGKRMQSPPICR